MTLGKLRSLGVRSLVVTCELCHHTPQFTRAALRRAGIDADRASPYKAVLPADRWPDAVLVRSFRPRMDCTACGIIGADARPDWREMQAQRNWRRT
jgi:hypothetical protein